MLQMLELLKNLDAYLDYSYEEARERFTEYISIHGIKRRDVDMRGDFLELVKKHVL